MKPITLFEFTEKYGDINFVSNGYEVTVQPSWIVDGEHRLSYTTIVRLIEFCREHHWSKDIRPFVRDNLDSITKSFSCDFKKPIETDSRISVVYKIAEVRDRSYRMVFEISKVRDSQLCVKSEMVSVFYSEHLDKSIVPPKTVTDKLKLLLSD